MILLFAKLILQNNFIKIIDEYNLNTRTGRIFSQKINNFNQKINNIEQIQSEFTPWADLLIKITDLTPQNIVLNSLYIEKVTREIQINGRAKTRQVLLDYQKNLKQAECMVLECLECKCFEETEIPLSSLLEKENIDFEIITKLKINIE